MRQTAFLAALLVFGSSAYAADPQLLNLVMPDAKILAGANGSEIQISPFGQYIIAKVSALDAGLQKLIAATGFNPLQDVTEVLAATNANASQRSSLLLVEGTFNVDKIAAAVSAHNKNVQTQTYQDATVLSFTNSKTNQTLALAFIGSSVAVAGPLADVEAAIMRNGGSATAIDPALAAQVNQLSSNQAEWLLSSVPVASLIPASATTSATGPAAQILPLLKSIQSLSGGVNFTDNVVMTGQATESDPQNAAALSAVVKLALSLASMGAANNAKLAELAQLLQTLQVTTDGSAVNVSLSIPETQVEALLNQVLKPAVPAIPANERPHRRANGN